jgi:hypothetical protein
LACGPVTVFGGDGAGNRRPEAEGVRGLDNLYQLAEPENRLVVRQLERDWEQVLAAQDRLTEQYEHYQATRPARLTTAELATIRALADDVPAIWNAPTTTPADHKTLLRTIIDVVQVSAEGAGERVHVAVVWAGGARTETDTVRPVAYVDQLSYYPRLVARLRELAAQGLTATAISTALTAEGLRPPRGGTRFRPGEIQHLIRQLGIRPGLDADRRTAHGELGPDQWWLSTLATEIGMPMLTLYTWLRRGWVHGQQDTHPPYRWIITADPAEVARLRALHQLPTGYHNRRPASLPRFRPCRRSGGRGRRLRGRAVPGHPSAANQHPPHACHSLRARRDQRRSPNQRQRRRPGRPPPPAAHRDRLPTRRHTRVAGDGPRHRPRPSQCGCPRGACGSHMAGAGRCLKVMTGLPWEIRWGTLAE